MVLAPNVTKVKPSATLAVSAKARAMRAQGIEVIELNAGELDFGTPRHICDAAITAINEGFTRYTQSSGIPELKKAISDKFLNDNGLKYSPSQIITNCGAKHSIFLAVFALIGPGDEVIIPSPYWVSYPEMVRLAGGIPVVLDARESNDLKITPEQLRNAITPKTKLLILNSPSNPTGTVYNENELRELAGVIVEKNIYVISDEIYEKLVYDDEKHISIASFSEDIFNRTITVNGVSKTYAMTGWRIGYTAAPEEIIAGMETIQTQEISNPTSISQKAALAALTGPQDFIEMIKDEQDKRRTYITNRLNSIDGVKCIQPKGAFYVFPDVSAFYGRKFKGKVIDGSSSMCDYMINEEKIAIVPGVAFGADAHVRFSYSVSMKDIERGLDRFESGLKALS